MGLGNLDIASFKPKRSETAASLLTVAPQQDAKKTERLELRIRSDVLMLFKEICKSENTDASKALRAYIDDTVSSGLLGDNYYQKSKSAFSDLSVQSVRTNENGPVQKHSQALAACGKFNLRNKEEREQWLKDFRTWGIWLDVPEVNKTFYRYDFINGCSIVVEVGVEYWDAYSTNRGKPHERISYSIIDNEHTKFNSQGDSFTMVIQWLTKYSKEL